MAKVTYLEFEKPVAQLEEKIQELRDMSSGSEGLDLTSDINGLERKKVKLLKEIFNKLSPWEMSLLARHPNRPYTLDYINMIFTDFHELHGDRAYADDPSIVGGMARFNGEPVMVIGHQKGRDTRERTLRNFGMSRPEGYRKALRLMHEKKASVKPQNGRRSPRRSEKVYQCFVPTVFYTFLDLPLAAVQCAVRRIAYDNVRAVYKIFGVAHIRANGLYVKSVELYVAFQKVVHDRLYFHGDKSCGTLLF